MDIHNITLMYLLCYWTCRWKHVTKIAYEYIDCPVMTRQAQEIDALYYIEK